MINIAILGLGRIGKIHVANIASDPKCNIECIYDIDNSISLEISKKYGCKVSLSAEEAISNPNVDAVCICSATPTHTKYILLAAKAGKAIFCEKPIDLDIKKVDQCKKDLKKYNNGLICYIGGEYNPLLILKHQNKIENLLTEKLKQKKH